MELDLEEGEVYTKEIEVDGNQPLSVGIVWNDPPSDPLVNPNHNDPTIMLINDLDLRVIARDGSEFYPWRMEPNDTYDNYTAPAEKGDNYRDNTELICEKNIPEGTYTIMITHKNTLQSGAQEFSMVINGIVGESTSTKEVDLSLIHI